MMKGLHVVCFDCDLASICRMLVQLHVFKVAGNDSAVTRIPARVLPR